MPVAHPFCRCRLISKRLIDGTQGREAPDASRRFLAQQVRRSPREAAKTAGHAAIWSGCYWARGVEDVLNPYRPRPYQLRQTAGGIVAAMDNAEIIQTLSAATDVAMTAEVFGDVWRGGEASFLNHIETRRNYAHAYEAEDYISKTAEC
jgi:hypothetical protein